jgi:hypothetical protein
MLERVPILLPYVPLVISNSFEFPLMKIVPKKLQRRKEGMADKYWHPWGGMVYRCERRDDSFWRMDLSAP